MDAGQFVYETSAEKNIEHSKNMYKKNTMNIVIRAPMW